ncbi:MAG TPA: tetratricopeptide repeat-containing protein, partial [Burkholderiales bacterium]|nr:tetratricopeptide repeat-containing protein [Burkholderiales bacterium]
MTSAEGGLVDENTRRERIAEATELAEAIVNGTEPIPDFQTLKNCVKWLKAGLNFGLGRKLLGRCRDRYDAGQKVWVIQQFALCTYKDEDRLPDIRFGEALKLLESVGLRNPDGVDPRKVPAVTLPETLALGGAVYKRMWEQSGQLENLHESFALYRSAWKRDPETDAGYGGVNAAFVLDILAARLRTIARRSGTGEDL